MRGPLLAVFALLFAASACSGATTRNKKKPEPETGGTTAAEASGGSGPAGEAPVRPESGATGIGGVPTAEGGAGAGGAPAEVCECMDVEIVWWVDRDSNPKPSVGELKPCAAFHFDEDRGEGMPRRICDRVVDCHTSFNPTNLKAALEHPDMQAALAQAPILYGIDKRPKGGQIDHMEIDGRVIEIGDDFDCAPSDAACKIPEGVLAFDQLIGRVTLVQLDDCGNSL